MTCNFGATCKAFPPPCRTGDSYGPLQRPAYDAPYGENIRCRVHIAVMGRAGLATHPCSDPKTFLTFHSILKDEVPTESAEASLAFASFASMNRSRSHACACCARMTPRIRDWPCLHDHLSAYPVAGRADWLRARTRKEHHSGSYTSRRLPCPRFREVRLGPLNRRQAR